MLRCSYLLHFVLFVLLCGISPTAAADAGLRWDIEMDRNSMTLTLRHKDPKAPLPFLAACEEGGDLKLTLGAPLDLVKKSGEVVSVKLESAGKSATISGKASFNAFTKVMELSVETNTENPMFAVLSTGKPVLVTRPAKTPMTWPAPNGEQVKLWATDCNFRSEH